VAGWKHHITGIGLETAYFAGLAGFAERKAAGHGIILKFQRVRPRSNRAFQPLRADEITPSFLRRTLATLKRRNFDIVSIDDACERIKHPAGPRRFAVLTFDGGYGDFRTYGYPVLQSHDVPFTVYVSTGLIDGVAFPWWLGLEAVVAQTSRISLVMNGEERRFRSTSVAEKYQVFDVIYQWLRGLPAGDATVALKDMCTRYHVDLKDSVRGALMTWTDLSILASDARATIGSATINHGMLTVLSEAAARRDIALGRRVLESALGRDCLHFAYPFGKDGTFTGREMRIVRDAGFASAVSSRAGLVAPGGANDVFDLPRLQWDGSRSSVRVLQVLMSGLGLPRRNRMPKPGH